MIIFFAFLKLPTHCLNVKKKKLMGTFFILNMSGYIFGDKYSGTEKMSKF